MLRGSRLADLIVDSLANVRRELKFFEDVAGRYGLDIDARGGVSEGVKRYRDLFFSTGEGIEEGKLLLVDGLVLLWGTEKVRTRLFYCPLHPAYSSFCAWSQFWRGS